MQATTSRPLLGCEELWTKRSTAHGVERVTSVHVPAGSVGIHVEVDGAGTPVVILHGFTGDCAAMAELASFLPGRSVRVDLVGHGRSDAPADPGNYTMEAMVVHLLAVLEHLDLEAVHLVGYSMGARTALSFAVAHPGRVRSLSLIGGTAGIADAGDAAARVAADEALAERIEAEGMAGFVDHWESLPIFESQRSLSFERRQAIRSGRLAQRPVGMANHLRGAGTGAMPPLWGDLGRLNAPVLLLAGSLDTKFVDLAREMQMLLPDAQLLTVEGVGHAAHLEAPRAVAQAIRATIARAGT
jgi:2-succinyl-6-hydroxy-2,4-cyclohexadiene-1-carboxylate synthase